MIVQHALADMTDAGALGLHPGIDGRLKGGDAIAALGTIKAFVSIHPSVLSLLEQSGRLRYTTLSITHLDKSLPRKRRTDHCPQAL
ncbi:hypothetical protein KTAU_08180 [Thermogemmatispora aurantia]|uniref:Uncharacterized protein n=1 Tax=Thermogemmatispora aurantia TaxID=2045279 RepID=A0A5J4K695_9CHLR|nr:hypothetical protein KTAU_08180 [Thermogemmatispora aurantia]